MINIKDHLHPTAYIPVNGDSFFLACTPPDDKGNYMKQNINRINEPCFVITPKDLLELKKQWAAEGFDAGSNFATEVGTSLVMGLDIDKAVPNKPTYINSLTIE